MSDWEPFRPCACDACGAPRPPGLCRRCRLAYYCDASCQRAVYKPRHRAACHAAARAGTLETVLRLCARGGRKGSVLGFLRQDEALELRAASRACRDAAAEHAWSDFDTHGLWVGRSRISGSVAAWRACFPYARAVNICGNKNVTDADFVHFEGIHTLGMSGCNQATITDAAFAHLWGLYALFMTACNQSTITDAAFGHLRGIFTLDIAGCNQTTITDAAFAHLAGLHTLYMFGCEQATITDAAFAHLRGIHTLNMSWCSQITDAAMVHLRGISNLEIKCCPRIHAVSRKMLWKANKKIKLKFK